MRNRSSEKRTFLRSRASIALLVFVGVTAVLLIYEHRAHILGDYWLLGGFLVLCVFLHGFMHRGHDGNERRPGPKENDR